MKNSILSGILFVGIGIFLIYWAQTHSPQAGIGQVIGNKLSGSYTMSETWYYVCLGTGIAFGLFGILKVFKVIR